MRSVPVFYGPPQSLDMDDATLWVVDAHWLEGTLGVLIRVMGRARGTRESGNPGWIRSLETEGRDGALESCGLHTGVQSSSDRDEIDLTVWRVSRPPAAIRIRIIVAEDERIVELREKAG